MLIAYHIWVDAGHHELVGDGLGLELLDDQVVASVLEQLLA